MRSFILSVTTALFAGLAVAGLAFAQTTATGAAQADIVKGETAHHSAPAKKVTPPAKPAVHKVAAVQHHVPVKKPVTPQVLRGTRYGGFAPSAPRAPAEPPVLDTTSPRSLSLTNVNSGESLTVTYWSNGTYHRDALDQLNHFLRDVKSGEQTEMDPLLMDVLWNTMNIVGFHGTVEVLSAYRSPETNAWLASVSRGVANDSQHMNGNAMDIRFPGVPVFKIRQAAYSLQKGGVGFYPRSGFVHIDTGSVRYW
jgi:uncharacterized protein YcbK (DUF882 family)